MNTRHIPQPDIITRGLSPSVKKRLPGDLWRSLTENAPFGVVGEIDQVTRAAWDFPAGGVVLALDALRAMNVTTAAAGGFAVGSEGGPIDPMLRAQSVVLSGGAQLITGLRGDLRLPREITGTTFSWLSETQEATETDGTYGALHLTPHRIAGATKVSFQLEAQAPHFMPFLFESFRRGIAAAIDAGALTGTGIFGQPQGIATAASVNEKTFGGAATLAATCDIVEQVCTNLGGDDPSLSWVAHPRVRERWQQIQKWTGASVALWGDDDTVQGKPARVTTAMAATDIYFGAFSKMVVGLWGEGTPIHILADRVGYARSGMIGLVVTCFADVGLLRPNCFTRNADTAVA